MIGGSSDIVKGSAPASLKARLLAENHDVPSAATETRPVVRLAPTAHAGAFALLSLLICHKPICTLPL
jgi:hypothetical protein